MHIGRLRHRVAIQTAATSRTDSGFATQTWTTQETVWASVEPISGRELMEADQVEGAVTHRVRMRYTANATRKARLVHDSRTLEILAVIDKQDRNSELELLCQEAV